MKKLIRDNILATIARNGEPLPPHEHVTGGEKLRYLLLKLVEESNEALGALKQSGEEGLVEELADVETVLNTIYDLKNPDTYFDLVFAKLDAKLIEKGGFDTGTVAEFPDKPERPSAPVEKCEHGCVGWCKECFLKMRDEALRKHEKPKCVMQCGCFWCGAAPGEWCKDDCAIRAGRQPK